MRKQHPLDAILDGHTVLIPRGSRSTRKQQDILLDCSILALLSTSHSRRFVDHENFHNHNNYWLLMLWLVSITMLQHPSIH
jgi:hypothetical protein